MESVGCSRVIRFGVFEVDLRSDELFKDGHKIKIQELPFQILAALLEHPGELVTREELQHKLWPQDTFVDFDHSLNTAVRLLRLALGDSTESPRYVETLPRKGYRFIYPVESLNRIITEGEVAQTRFPVLRLSGTQGHPVSSEAREPLRSPPLSMEPSEGVTHLQRGVDSHLLPASQRWNSRAKSPTLDKTLGQATNQKKKHWHRGAVAALCIVLAVIGAFYFYRENQRGTLGPEPVLVPVPFTTYPGHQGYASFSPDGNQVAFVWDGEKQDNTDIYIKQIGSESPRRLTSDPAIDHYPAWSPDGQSIAFLRDLDPGFKAVMLIPANGGRERKVTELRMAKIEEMSRLLCWHPGGKWLAVSCDQDSTDAPTAIYLLSPETHEKRRLTSPPKGVKVDTNPAFSPDGRTLAFVRYGFGGTSEIYLQRVSGEVVPEGEPRQLTSMNQDTCYPAWMPDGKEIVFASGSKSHSCRLWRIPISGSIPPKPLPFSSEVNGLNPVISLEKHRLVYSVFSVDANIWRCEIPKGGAEPAPQQRFLPSSRVQEGPQYSPDGKSIAYLAWTSGSGEIWVCDSDGANPMQLTQLGGPVPQHPNWSPDGQKIIFALASRGQTDLYVIPVQGGEMRQLTHTTFNELGPSFSRDGKWIYFGSDHNGDFQIWKMPAEGGEALLVARRGGSTPQESPDGKVLFYLKSGPDEDWPDELWKVPVEGGEETQVLDEVWYRDFVVKQDGIYFRRLEQDSTCFLFYDFAQGKTKPIAKIRKGEGFGLTVSPDEQWILFAQVGDLRNYLMLVENFR